MPWVVTDKRGELYAIEEVFTDAVEKADDARIFLDEARRCGHPAAAPWVNERLPLSIELETELRAVELREEWGTPVLDREG